MTQGKRLFTVGEVLAVMLAEPQRSLAEATTYRRIIAGSESNVAAGFVRLGHRATLVTRVGKDGFGDAIVDALESWGIDAVAGRSDRPTGVIARILGTNAGGESIQLRTGAAATELGPHDIDAAWRDDIAVVFVTGITAVRSEGGRLAVERTVELARRDGALVVVDPNVRPKLASPAQFTAALAGLRGHIDVAIGDAEELAVLAGTSCDSAPRTLLDEGCRAVVCKLGAAGAVVITPDTEYRVSSRAVEVVDTVGAGDAFAAGYLAALVEGSSMDAALELASAVAAAVVATVGDVEGLPSRGSLEEAGMQW